jgi:hypothetical protein
MQCCVVAAAAPSTANHAVVSVSPAFNTLQQCALKTVQQLLSAYAGACIPLLSFTFPPRCCCCCCCCCRRKEGQAEVTQVWKAEEGDLTSPKLQKQREQLPQLQKDPLQLQLEMDTLIVEIAAAAPLMEVRTPITTQLRMFVNSRSTAKQHGSKRRTAAHVVVHLESWGVLQLKTAATAAALPEMHLLL